MLHGAVLTWVRNTIPRSTDGILVQKVVALTHQTLAVSICSLTILPATWQSANLMKFFDTETNTLDVEGFEYTCRLWTVVLEISVLMARFHQET